MSQINIEAKKERHKKLYEGQYHSFVGAIWFHFKKIFLKILRFLTPSRKRFSQFMHPLDNMPAPKRLYTQLSIWSIALLLLTSVNVTNASTTGGEGVGAEYLSLNMSENLITDEEGYLIKSMPLEGEAVYDQNRTENIMHEVQDGETLSLIAYRYGVSVNSIKYANKGLTDFLKIGQELTIPPKDGLYVKVEKNDSLVKLVEKYKGNLEKTMEFNGITDDSELIADKDLFVIDGRPAVVYVATKPIYSSSSPSGSVAPPTTQYYNIPPNAQGWIRPTQGLITQGFHGGHYAYDIADRSKPPILAAAPGTVIKASSGNWGGGYGNHIIIDHGNGYQTLYAHAEVIYVNVGDVVQQGQVIAKMGATGNVRGVTGIHLHFELSYNGKKINPSVMGVW